MPDHVKCSSIGFEHIDRNGGAEHTDSITEGTGFLLLIHIGLLWGEWDSSFKSKVAY